MTFTIADYTNPDKLHNTYILWRRPARYTNTTALTTTPADRTMVIHRGRPTCVTGEIRPSLLSSELAGVWREA